MGLALGGLDAGSLASRPASCHTKDCLGWKIDDFAINNDNPRVGYYTSFDGSYDANLR